MRRLLVIAALASCGGPTTGSIGAVLGPQDGRLVVVEAPSDMAGARAGLSPGDEILAIDGRDVKELSREQIVQALRGNVGTVVTLRVKRDGMMRDIKVERGPFAPGKR